MTNVLSIVSYPFLPAKMGGQKGIALFYKYFGQKVNLTCAGVKENNQQFAENYTLVKLFGKSGLRYINLFYFFPLRKIIKENKIEWLLLEHPYYGWLALLLKYFCKVKLIAKSHNIEALRFKSVGKWWWGILWH
ncbi:MAG TPA: glycosyl transferase group 1, partial [Chitinophagaceae bacterium]|nr:glycosyl transferase group 1 [Chitinophagaceae bacterium]